MFAAGEGRLVRLEIGNGYGTKAHEIEGNLKIEILFVESQNIVVEVECPD